jgi:hypothetical protein
LKNGVYDCDKACGREELRAMRTRLCVRRCSHDQLVNVLRSEHRFSPNHSCLVANATTEAAPNLKAADVNKTAGLAITIPGANQMWRARRDAALCQSRK